MYRTPTKLFGTENAKTSKGTKKGYTTYIMYLAPFTQNSKGVNLCAHASKGCAEACLFGAGRGVFTNVEEARINKTEYYLADRTKFLNQIDKELGLAVKRHGKSDTNFAVRLNGTSDVRFEKFKVRDGKNLFELYPTVQFYDYTKNIKKLIDNKHENYHLTFSRSEDNEAKVKTALKLGYNVAMVFDNVPTEYMGHKVVDGDESDLRFLDEQNVIVGLKYKKIRKKGFDQEIPFKSGFVVSV